MAAKRFDLAPPPEPPAALEHTPVRVTYHDTDQMGHVYYGNYLTWFEIGRTEWLRSRGQTYEATEKDGIFLPVTGCYCEYIRPSLYDDLLRVTAWVAETRRASLRFGYEIHCDARGELLARGWTQHAFVDRDRKIVAVPAPMRALLRGETPSPNEIAKGA